ncbi:hypothetical protein [Saccharolobus islandicus]|uniref:Uncharacterized protein n=1 Tax=Saccharolobus islandicus (strain M.16.4 / Kamchatka \|nr:hypothetical protein [Sulfolobus islandicus]ACR40787.1 hypothetical protein M164_0153 [Sulfolobus islandicus M.16.4]
MSKFNYKKLSNKDNGVFLRISSERAVFKAVGDWHKTKSGFIAVPVKIYAGVFKDFNGKKHTEGKGTLLLPGLIENYEDVMKALEDGEIIGVVCEKKEKDGKILYYLNMYAIIENPEDIEDFMIDDINEEAKEDGED